MDPLIFHNGRILPLAESHLSPGQVGLFTGWGVFTTLRIYEGFPFGFERHWARLTRDASRLRVPMPYSLEQVRNAVIELARANRRPEGAARATFVRNRGGIWSEAAGHPETDLVVFTKELSAWPAANRLVLIQEGIFSISYYAGTKILSWVPHAAVLEKAQSEGFDEALLVNEKGELAECTAANIFLVREGRVLTPPLASGCLPGITREVLLEIAPRAGVEIQERDLTPGDLNSASEVFISSTTREVAPVSAIDPRWKFSVPGKVTQELERAFQEYVRAWLAREHAARPTG